MGHSRSQKVVQTLRDQGPALLEKCLVARNIEERRVSRYALRLKRSRSRLREHWREVLVRRLVADLAVSLTGDEAEICDIIGLSAGIAGFEHGLWKDVMELELVLRTADDVAESIRAARLSLDKVVKARKEALRLELTSDAVRRVREHYASISAELGDYAPGIPASLVADMGAAIKGLKSLASIRDRLDQAVADAKIAADELARRIRANRALLDAATAEPNSKPCRTENLGCAMNIRHINAMLHPLSVTRETLSALGFEPAGFDKASILYMVEDFPAICHAIAKRASDAAAVYEKDKNHA